MTKLNADELNKLIQVCDIAVKSGGLNIAKEVLPLAEKLSVMISETKPLYDEMTGFTV